MTQTRVIPTRKNTPPKDSVLDVIGSRDPVRLRAVAARLATEGRAAQAAQLNELAQRAEAKAAKGGK